MAKTNGGTVNSERHARVALIELNRPEAMNSIDPVMKLDLPAALEDAARDPEVGAVVLTGAGKAFCTGSDLKAGGGGSDTGVRKVARSLLYDYQPVLDLIMRMDKPVIAAVNGPAAGMGMSLALACDLMVMSRSAYLLSPFINVGLVPDGGAAWFLTRRLGYGRAFEVLADAQKISAEQCLGWGLANRLAEPDELRASALQWAAQLAERAPVAMALTKRIARMSLSSGLSEMLGVEAELQAMCANTADSREAIAAFVEKRKPTFRGL
ncbi:enoyl-CoA hydratase/isomerase family protein [Hydrocarboniphaga sp.]|uniref:enoyl-CoA hydratase/isomerase family protein n=1 Tax=Hydrocarboniphaga sp. TaxID=2033016 RepID=UPI003D12FA47